MHGSKLAAAIGAVVLLSTGRAAADDAALLRVFLTDGTSIVSFGEPARVGNRVVFSMPTGTSANPPLHLVNLPLERVDWERTDRYASNARAAHYVRTQADSDYAALSNEVATTLSDVARTTDPARRLAIVERARTMLADWPQNHYNYRQAEVRQMLTMLDDAIADLQAVAGRGRFNLTLSAFVDPPAVAEPLLPPPSPKEAIEQVLTAARAVDSPAERTSLLSAAIVALDREGPAVPSDWAAAARTETRAQIRTELRLDRSYQLLTTRTMQAASQRARLADVRGLERLLQTIPQRDRTLGGKRPDAVNALVAAVEERLDAARQLRLARDRFALRARALNQYRVAIRASIALFAQLRPSLEAVKALSGSNPARLDAMQAGAAKILSMASAISPPDEAASAHALLISATQLAGNAAQIRREATVANNMTRAWDASSAAAGALMLGARARADLKALSRPPQLR